MGLKIKEFMFGLPGPRLFSFKWGETEYGSTMVPFGGYVRFAGTESELQVEEDDEDKNTPPERKYDAQPRWKKALIMVAGPTMNLLFPILLVALILSVQGMQDFQPVIGKVVKGSPAQTTGFKPGDRIVKIDGEKVETWSELTTHLRGKPGEKVDITIERGNATLVLRPTLNDKDGKGFLGVELSKDAKPVYKREPIHRALYRGTILTYNMTKFMVVTLYHVITQDTGILAKSSGPVGIVDLTAKIAQQDFWRYVEILALISINIGLLNLLPIPPLDGGRLAILGIEAVGRRSLNKKVILAVNAAGMALLLLLMLYITIADLGRIFLPKLGAGGG